MGLPGFTAYAASKAAVRNFVRGWTLELKDRKIRVNCMSPGVIDTPALATTTALPLNRSSKRSHSSPRRSRWVAGASQRKSRLPVTFLASDESSYITGVDLAVDGAWRRFNTGVVALKHTRSDVNANGDISMSTQENVHDCEGFFAALGRRDKQGLLALSAEDIEWIVPGKGWPLAGTHRGHAGLENLLQQANETVETSYPKPPEFVAQGDRVLMIGSAKGRIKATNRTFEDDWIFAIIVRNGKLTEHPGVYRHASTGAGLRDGREPQTLIHRPHETIRKVS